MFDQNRDQMRQFYCEVWHKKRQSLPLEPLELQISEVIAQHPEYHQMLQNPEQACTKEYLPESGDTNPFLHMGLHIAIQEQLATNRPAGIRALYQQLLPGYSDTHALEHSIMQCLTEMIWYSQRHKTTPDEQAYLKCIQALQK